MLRGALIIGALLAPLLLLELAVRALGPILPGDYQTAAFTSSSATAGRQNRPYSGGYKRTSEYTTRVRVNSQRLRGAEIEYAKAPGTFRTLVLGDSFTFAMQVDEEETFVLRLGEHLARTTGAEAPFEMINAGTDGWSTVNEYVWLTAEGHRYEPDLVILMFYVGNDPGENADQVRAIGPGGRVLPEEGQAGPWRQARLELSELSVAYNMLEYGVLAKLNTPPERASTRSAKPAGGPRESIDERKDRGWEISEVLLGQLREYCAARGVGLMVVGIPTLDRMRADDERPTPLMGIGERTGAPIVDLTEPFRALPLDARTGLYFEKDRHWTAEGHDLAARIVASELREWRLVPGSPEPDPRP